MDLGLANNPASTTAQYEARMHILRADLSTSLLPSHSSAADRTASLNQCFRFYTWSGAGSQNYLIDFLEIYFIPRRRSSNTSCISPQRTCRTCCSSPLPLHYSPVVLLVYRWWARTNRCMSLICLILLVFIYYKSRSTRFDLEAEGLFERAKPVEQPSNVPDPGPVVQANNPPASAQGRTLRRITKKLPPNRTAEGTKEPPPQASNAFHNSGQLYKDLNPAA